MTNASAGAVEHLRLVQVTNINHTIEELKEAGVWVAGLDRGLDAMLLVDANLAGGRDGGRGGQRGQRSQPLDGASDVIFWCAYRCLAMWKV